MKWTMCWIYNPKFELTVPAEEGATAVPHVRMTLVASNATDAANQGAGRISQAKAANKKPALEAYDFGQTIQQGVCAAKLPCYRTCCGGSESCNRLQIQSSYSSAELLLQIESKMRYYPACIPGGCLFTCRFFEHQDGRIQCSVHDGQVAQCDCPAAMDTLLSLRGLAA